MELQAWYADESYWPKKGDFRTFPNWFHAEIHSTVIDPFEDDIEKEYY